MAKLRYAFFPGCTLESAAGELKVSICEREGKANLEASPVMTELRRRCEQYRERRRHK